MSRLKRRSTSNDDLFGWIGLGLVLVASLVLDKADAPRKWHAAIMWTFVALFGVLIFGRQKRSSWLFWIFWTACLIMHVLAMWLIFGKLFPRLVLGTLYVVPVAFIEAIIIVVIFLKVDSRIAASDHK